MGALVAESSAASRERPETAGAVVPAGGAARDGLDALLDALAAVYDVFPDLWLDSRLRCAHALAWHTVSCIGSFAKHINKSGVQGKRSRSLHACYSTRPKSPACHAPAALPGGSRAGVKPYFPSTHPEP